VFSVCSAGVNRGGRGLKGPGPQNVRVRTGVTPAGIRSLQPICLRGVSGAPSRPASPLPACLAPGDWRVACARTM
jgi:hypothetical protein